MDSSPLTLNLPEPISEIRVLTSYCILMKVMYLAGIDFIVSVDESCLMSFIFPSVKHLQNVKALLTAQEVS